MFPNAGGLKEKEPVNVRYGSIVVLLLLSAGGVQNTVAIGSLI